VIDVRYDGEWENRNVTERVARVGKMEEGESVFVYVEDSKDFEAMVLLRIRISVCGVLGSDPGYGSRHSNQTAAKLSSKVAFRHNNHSLSENKADIRDHRDIYSCRWHYCEFWG
jgi:hypothetical protein